MALPHDPMRRKVAASLAGALAFGNSAATTGDARQVVRRGSRRLVAYFSRSGNTRVVAGLVQRQLGADLFEIQPARPYPLDYLETVEQARRERDSRHEPALAAKVTGLADYDTLYLGFPIWGGTAPPVIRSFLSAHALAGKTLVPFITHGGYGLGDSRSVLSSHAPEARLREGFSMEADQERRTMEQVTEWLRQD